MKIPLMDLLQQMIFDGYKLKHFNQWKLIEVDNETDLLLGENIARVRNIEDQN